MNSWKHAETLLNISNFCTDRNSIFWEISSPKPSIFSAETPRRVSYSGTQTPTLNKINNEPWSDSKHGPQMKMKFVFKRVDKIHKYNPRYQY